MAEKEGFKPSHQAFSWPTVFRVLCCIKTLVENVIMKRKLQDAGNPAKIGLSSVFFAVFGETFANLGRHRGDIFYQKHFAAVPSPTVDNLIWTVKMMAKKQYEDILRKYPEYITKEQLYRICHVSKHTARFYLESGLIPSVNSGKKTRKYKIATKDVVDFLVERDANPKRCLAPDGWYQGNNSYKPKPRFVLYKLERNKETKSRLTRWLIEYPDLLKSSDAAKITGYATSTVLDWCNDGKLKHFLIRRMLLIPKRSLIDFMMSDGFRGIKVRSEDYREFVAEFEET